MTLARFKSIYGELMQIICQQLAPAHPCCSRFSVIAKAMLATVMTLLRYKFIYGELMQIIRKQLAPVHPCCSRSSVIAKAILGTVMTLARYKSIYGELMQISCQQLAPAQSFYAVRVADLGGSLLTDCQAVLCSWLFSAYEMIRRRASPAGLMMRPGPRDEYLKLGIAADLISIKYTRRKC